MRRFASLFFILLPIGLAIIYLFIPKSSDDVSITMSNGITGTTGNDGANGQLHPLHDAQRMLFLLQYIGVDYNGAVSDGKVIDEFEYREMNEFCQTILATYKEMPPAPETATISVRLQHLQNLIQQRAAWQEIIRVTHELIPALTRQLHVVPYPVKLPDLANGKRLYAENCADCHGINGNGRGPSSADLNPPPSNFNDATRLLHLTPYQFYNAMTFGVDGTAMGTFSDLLTPQERWDIAFYLMTINPAASTIQTPADAPFSLRELATESNAELAERLAQQRVADFQRHPASDSILQAALADVDQLRRQLPGITSNQSLVYAREQLEKSLQAYEAGEVKKAVTLAIDSYLHGIEKIELELQAVDSDLKLQLEKDCAHYRTALSQRAAMTTVRARYRDLLTTLEKVEAALSTRRQAWGFGFVQAIIIILREGIEAALLLGLMLTYLTATGFRSLRRYVVFGGLAGLLVGVITWGAARTLITISPLQREALEGLTSLLAAAVLLSISLWMIHHADLQRWKNYIRRRAEIALSTGSILALAFAAFLAVYREAFETVLFFEVLWFKAPAAHTGILLGFVVGALALTILMTAIFRFGLRIPLKPFFSATGALLGLLVFVFVGYGIRELQSIGWIKETAFPWDLRLPLLDIYPTVEGIALQTAVVLTFVLGWLATKLEQGQRRQMRPAMEAA